MCPGMGYGSSQKYRALVGLTFWMGDLVIANVDNTSTPNIASASLVIIVMIGRVTQICSVKTGQWFEIITASGNRTKFNSFEECSEQQI